MIPVLTIYYVRSKFWFMLVTILVILLRNVYSLTPSSIYSHCSTNKTVYTPERGCVFEGKDNCLSKKNCEFLLTFTRSKTTKGVYEFEMLGYPKKRDNKVGFYMAMAVSKGPIMGQDLVVSCGVDNHNPKIKNVFIQLSYNTQTKYGNDPYFSNFVKQRNQLKAGEIKYENGVMLCSFTLPNNTEVQTETFDFEKEENVIFLANGGIKVERKQGKEMIRIQYHSLTEAYLTEKLWMKEKLIWQANNDKGKEDALRVHMSLMVVAFVVLMPTSMIIARFFKESQVKQRIFHRRIWFVLHSLSLSLGLAFVFVALIIIGVQIGNYNGTKQHPHFKIHYSIGTVAVAGYVSQMLMGLYMALTEDHRGVAKLVLSVLHWFFGVVTYILGMIQIFLAPYSMAVFISSYCSISSIVLLFWILLHIIFYFILTCLLYKSDNMSKIRNKEIGTDVESIVSTKSSDEKIMLNNNENSKTDITHKTTSGGFEEEKTEEEFENRKSSIASKKSNKSQLLKLSNPNLIISNKMASKSRLKKTKNVKNKIAPVQIKEQDEKDHNILNSKVGKSKTKNSSGNNKNKVKLKRKTSTLENKLSLSTMEKAKEQLEKINVGKSQIPNSSSGNPRRKIMSRNNSKTFVSGVDSRNFHRTPSNSINQIKQNQNYEDHENEEMQIDEKKHEDSIDQSPVLTFLPQRKDTEIVFDEHPSEYQTNNMLPVSGKHLNSHHHHTLDKDPRRAFKSYPLKIRSVEEYPRTFVIEILIGLFFLFSILTAIFLCYTLFPNISRDPDPDGSDENVHCEAENGKPMWMHKFP